MRRYDNYLDTGNEWLPKVPQHWQAVKLKYCGLINPSSRNYDFERTSDDLVVFLPMEKVSEDGQITQDSRREIQQVITGFTYFERNDILVAKITPCFENGKGALLKDLETNFGFGSTEFHVLRPTERIAKEFLFYITRTDLFKRNGEALMTGSAGQKRVPQNFIEQLLIGLPPLQEQTEIANYLDEKIAQIDALIEKKQKLIELLKEERKAIINDAVSGEGKNWDRKKLKYIGEVISGAAFSSSDFSTTGPVRVLKISNIQHDFVDWTDSEYVSEDVAKANLTCRVLNGDIVFALTRPIISSGIKSARAFFNPDEIVLLNQRNAILRLHQDVDCTFIYYVTHSKYFFDMFQLSIDNTGQQPNISPISIKNFEILLPAVDVQAKIAKEIAGEIARVDKVIERVSAEIELINEYKTALISEVVTGKVKVI